MTSEQASQQQEQSGGEFEREPVPEKAHKGAGAFWGMYAGEHTAGTEFMIGPLFVSWGVGAFDMLVGLLVGNLLAVLSWRFVTAPIATRHRLTLYYQLERICGRKLVVLYNHRDAVLRRYWLLDRVRGALAMGYSGPRTFAPRADGSSILLRTRDCAPYVGIQHSEMDYYQKACRAGTEMAALIDDAATTN